MKAIQIFRQIATRRDRNHNLIYSRKFEFEGLEIMRLRETFGVSQNCFAELASRAKTWSTVIEKPGIHKVQFRTMLRICYTFGILEGIKKTRTFFNKRENRNGD